MLRALRLVRLRSTLASSRLLSTLTLIEHADGALSPATANVLTAARQLGGPVTALVAGSKQAEVTASLTKLVDAIVTADSPVYNHNAPENTAELVALVAREGGFTHVVAASSTFGKGVLPRAAALLDVQPITDVIKIESQDVFQRPIYAGNAIATTKSSDKIKVLTVRPTAFEAAQNGSAEAESTAATSTPTAARSSEFVSQELTKSERPDLGSASRVVSGGRGLKDRENFDKIMIPFADALGAAVGASRAAVDSGFADNSLQVGQTGKVVAPELYVAVGISGAIQHLAGMKDSKVIVAINKDKEAPIFHVADFGLEADLFEAVPDLTQKLK